MEYKFQKLTKLEQQEFFLKIYFLVLTSNVAYNAFSIILNEAEKLNYFDESKILEENETK